MTTLRADDLAAGRPPDIDAAGVDREQIRAFLKLTPEERLRHRPSASLAVDPTLQKSYVGRYQIEKGPLLEVFLDGKRLMVRQQGQGDADELLPESATEFSVPKYNVWISFVRDAAGKVTKLVGYQGGDFTAKRVD